MVVTWRGVATVAACLAGLAAQTRPHRLLVVDNASDDGTADVLAGHPSRPPVLRLRRNRGYAGGLAAALGLVDTRYVAWLNDDAVPEPGWLAACEDALAADPRAAAVSAVLLRPDGGTQSVGVGLTADGHGYDLASPGEPAEGGLHPATPAEGHLQPSPQGEGHHQPQPREVFGFCGGAALLRVDALRAAGGVPAGYFCYYEDTDTSWRLRLAGWRVLSAPAALVRHEHGASSRIGSARFHRWNERNRLLTLIRCAPTGTAATQLLRFAAITAVLPARRLRGHRPQEANLAVALRLRVLGELAVRLPSALLSRRRIRGYRRAVWRDWADHPVDQLP